MSTDFWENKIDNSMDMLQKISTDLCENKYQCQKSYDKNKDGVSFASSKCFIYDHHIQ